jgi:hypothetical protein
MCKLQEKLQRCANSREMLHFLRANQKVESKEVCLSVASMQIFESRSGRVASAMLSNHGV